MANTSMANQTNIEMKKNMIAIALCLIKRKPPNISIKEFCITVQNRLKESDEPNLNDEASISIYDVIFSNPEIIEESKLYIASKLDMLKCSEQDNVEKIQLKINFHAIHAIKSIKNFLIEHNVTFEGQNDFNIEKLDNSINTQSQMYKKGMSERLLNEKKLSSINTSMLILIELLIHIPENLNNDDIIVYVSDLIGKSIDVMHEKNIFIPALDKIMSIIDDHIQNLLKEPHCTDKLKQRYFSVLFLLNKSRATIHHTILELIARIEEFLDTLKLYDNSEIIEVDETDNLFYVFELLEEHYKLYSTHSFKIKNKLSECELSQQLMSGLNILSKSVGESEIFEKMRGVLTRVAIECVDAYPLVSFWAMEMINSGVVTLESMEK